MDSVSSVRNLGRQVRSISREPSHEFGRSLTPVKHRRMKSGAINTSRVRTKKEKKKKRAVGGNLIQEQKNMLKGLLEGKFDNLKGINGERCIDSTRFLEMSSDKVEDLKEEEEMENDSATVGEDSFEAIEQNCQEGDSESEEEESQDSEEFLVLKKETDHLDAFTAELEMIKHKILSQADGYKQPKLKKEKSLVKKKKNEKIECKENVEFRDNEVISSKRLLRKLDLISENLIKSTVKRKRYRKKKKKNIPILVERRLKFGRPSRSNSRSQNRLMQKKSCSPLKFKQNKMILQNNSSVISSNCCEIRLESSEEF
jgi:hypothetical protein